MGWGGVDIFEAISCLPWGHILKVDGRSQDIHGLLVSRDLQWELRVSSHQAVGLALPLCPYKHVFQGHTPAFSFSVSASGQETGVSFELLGLSLEFSFE